jgi:hypothetical protein
MARRKGQSGQAALEFVLAYGTVILPVTVMIIFTAQMMWVWHTMSDFARQGARYATTHCWQGAGDNVRSWMQQNVPLTYERDQFTGGPAQIEIDYYARDPESGTLADFACDGGDCSTSCIPDTVRVRITGYEFRGIFTYLGLPPVTMPDFQTTLSMESAGCSPDSEECLP